MKPVDAVVVGSVVVGSIMSMELANAGLEVLCLERGRMIDPQTDFFAADVYDERNYDRHSDIFENLARERSTFRNSMSQTALSRLELVWIKPGETVGGTAAKWSGSPRLLLPHDSEIRTKVQERYGKRFCPEDCPAQDWGVTWDQIEPYYDQ